MNTVDLLVETVREHAPRDIWRDSPLIGYRMLGNTNRTFQFNHVRMDREYAWLLCLGICPDAVVFNMWRKGMVAEGRAGALVRMAEGQAVTWKITKKLEDMRSIDDLPAMIRQALTEYEGA